MHDDNSSGIANSFTDLMTSLAIIFILLLCASMNNAFEAGKSTRSKIFEQLQKELKIYGEKGVVVKEDANDPLMLLILVPSGYLDFDSGSYKIQTQGNNFLNAFIPRLTDTIYSKDFRNEISSVVVEGHTDSDGSDTDNLYLSQKRSMAVIVKCLDILQLDTQDQNKTKYFLDKLSANGRGERELVIINGKEDKDQSRRVIFKIRVRSFEEKTIKRLTNA